MKKFLILLTCSVLTITGILRAQPAPVKEGNLAIHFNNVVDGAALKLNDSVPYKNAHGDDFKITIFKYYISNISLIGKDDHAVAIPDSYFLVNAADTASLDQQVKNIPAGKYKGISFTIGVDSARNFSGVQTGCLDPAKGMFWTWNSGYIFVMLEGESPASTAKRNHLTFHIGGLKAGHNTIRTFTQEFGKTLKIEEGKSPQLELVVDAAALFKGKTTIDFSKLNFTMGGPNSVIVADNYADGLFHAAKVRN